MLGVQIGPVTRDLADAFGLTRAQGALVSGVTKGNAAEKAGIKEGDVILKFNDRSVEDSRDLPRFVTAVRPGTPAKVQVWREGKALDLSVTLDEFKDVSTVAAASEKSAAPKAAAMKPETMQEGRLGLVLRSLTEKERTATGLKSGGVAVDSLDDKSAAQALTEGDVIVSVTRRGKSTAVSTPAQLVDLIKSADKGATLAFRVKRATNRSSAEYAEFFAPEKLPE
jgi:serine protease Do